MSLLSICIPNYNRETKLKRLLEKSVHQIKENNFESIISICISDDCSPVDPSYVIRSIIEDNPGVDIRFKRNDHNLGMDWNFLNSVLMSDSKYCMIVGNDDLLEEEGLIAAVETIRENPGVDLVISPFDSYDDDLVLQSTIWPLSNNTDKIYDTYDENEKKELLMSVCHNSGIFMFLSNVIFKRDNWIERKESFRDKMNSIFIQMYINIDTLLEGCKLYYTSRKIVINQTDSVTNKTLDRMCRILFGLDDVVEYFFSEDIKRHFKRILTDAYIVGELWELPEETDEKKRLRRIDSEKNNIYRKFYIPSNKISKIIGGRHVLIFGAGEYGRRTYKKAVSANAKVVGVSDSSPSKIGCKMSEMIIMSPSDMIERYKQEDFLILVANHHNLPEMVGYLINNNVEDARIAVVE